MSEFRVGQVTSEVSVTAEPEAAPERPSTSTPEAVERARALRARVEALAARTRAEGFED